MRLRTKLARVAERGQGLGAIYRTSVSGQCGIQIGWIRFRPNIRVRRITRLVTNYDDACVDPSMPHIANRLYATKEHCEMRDASNVPETRTRAYRQARIRGDEAVTEEPRWQIRRR